MAELVLFHHAQGLTEGMRAFADRLRSAGHHVAMPDLFDGATFSTVEEGVEYAEGIGFDEIISRGEAAVADLPPPSSTEATHMVVERTVAMLRDLR